MRLIKLDIVGFKSFQEKTSVVFPRGITAVVGPNGCGKSNIVDALRWVMGEQSAKQLRGKSMEDLIFAGADNRQPLNMAEVSLTIENSGGDAPESPMNPYTEIMVTRRVYRSGESAYMINRQPCRLKDIHNLFLGSGSGKNSFAVIQQGNIGALTDATPEERRFFIEDAADVTKYKERRKETQSRIKGTQENVLRISDIISELKRQIAVLDRQVAKARKFKEYRARSKELDITIALWYFERYSRDIQSRKQRIDQLKDADAERARELFDLEQAMAATVRESEEQKNHIEEVEQERFDLRRRLDKKENDHEHLTRESSRLTGEMEEIESKIKNLDRRNEDLVVEIQQAKDSHVDLDDDLNRARTDLDQERKDLDALKSRLKEYDLDLQALRKNLMGLTGNEAKTHSMQNHAMERKDALVRRLKRMDEDVLDAGKRYDAALREKEEAALSVEERQLDIRDLTAELDSLRTHMIGLRTNHDEKRRELRQQDMEHSALLSRHSTLKAIEEQYGWYEQGVKAVMENVSEGDKPSVLGLVAEKIRPKPGYESALETALGESLQFVIVDHVDTAWEWIRFLKDGDKGHCGFVPLGHVSPADFQTVPPGFMPLSDGVDAAPEDRELVRALIGHVLVPEKDGELPDFSQAHGRWAVVTRDGDRISERGLIRGGSFDPDASIFGKKKELEDLERALAENESLRADVKEKLEALDRDITEKSLEEKECKERLAEAGLEKQDAEKTLLMAGEALRQAGQRRDVLALEQEQVQGEEEDLDAEIETHSKSLETIRDDIRIAESKQEDAQAQVGGLTRTMEEKDKKVVDLQLHITSLKTRQDNYHGSLKRLEDFLEDGRSRKIRLSEELTDKQNRLSGILKTLETDQHEREALSRSLALTDENLLVARRDLAATEKQIKDREKDKQKILKDRENDHQVQQAQEIELTQLRLKRETLTGRIEEKYHHRINQYSLEFEEKDISVTGLSAFDITSMETELKDLTKKISQLGDVNLSAISEYEELKTRYDFMIQQQDDLVKSLEDLEAIIRKINKVSQERFLETFNAINEKLGELFPTLFEGGSARMVLTEPSSPLTTGVELMIQPPGKKLTRLSLLSGGEKALSAIAFVFSIFLIKPSSFCIMDEIDAPLDDANVVRFNNLVKHIGIQSQILVITHNKLTMEFADVLFGVTMEKKGVSKIVSVSLSGDDDDTVAVA